MARPTMDRSTVDHIATLASISLTDEEAERMARELAAIVAYVAELQGVDTTDVAEVDRVAPGRWREDLVAPGLSHAEALSEAPEATDDGFAVPTFVHPSGGSGGRG